MVVWLAIMLYLLLAKIFKGKLLPAKVYNSGDKKVDDILLLGQEYIQQLNALNLQDIEINRHISNMQRISEQIFDHIAKNPKQSNQIATFINYYYPTMLKFLNQYKEYDSKKVKVDNIQSTLQKIRQSLVKFEEAFLHQLDSLYSDKAIDIETDIVVLDGIMKNNGL